VKVSGAIGRDGGIDAHIETDVALPPILQHLQGPIIVEYKDNDDSLGRVRENVKAAWKKVEKKLSRQAVAGWPVPYDPWRRARSYARAELCLRHKRGALQPERAGGSRP
jgi:hypothetical protein